MIICYERIDIYFYYDTFAIADLESLKNMFLWPREISMIGLDFLVQNILIKGLIYVFSAFDFLHGKYLVQLFL